MRLHKVTLGGAMNRHDLVKAVDDYYCGNFSFFFDEFEDNTTTRFECIRTDEDECYIIDLKRGAFINWYKETHLGRCLTTNFTPTADNLREFIREFSIENSKVRAKLYGFE